MKNIPKYVRPGGTSYVSPEGVIFCTDGKVRWVYEIDQRKRPTVLWGLLGKYMNVCGAIGLLILLVQGCTGGVSAVLGGLPVALAVLGTGAVLAALSYTTHRMQNGPLVCKVFTLGADTVTCQQVKGKNDKEKVTHAFAVWVGGQSQPAVRVSSLREMRLGDVRGLAVHPTCGRIKLRGKKGVTLYADPQQVPVVLGCLKEYGIQAN